jgi:hypothetical protein
MPENSLLEGVLLARARELVTTILVERDETQADALIELLMIFGDAAPDANGQRDIAAGCIEHAFTYTVRFSELLDKYTGELKRVGYGTILAMK